MYTVKLFRGIEVLRKYHGQTPMDCLQLVAMHTQNIKGFDMHKAVCTNRDGNEQWTLIIA